MSLVGSGVPCPTAPLSPGVAYPVVCGSNAVIPGSVSATNLDGISIGNQSLLGTNAIQLNPLVTCNPSSNLGSHQFINPELLLGADRSRPEWSDAPPGVLWPCFLRLRPGTVQELPDQGIDESCSSVFRRTTS